jgi:alkylation response protein AidB-like acyl-CoA dehydrogenase
MVLKEEMWIHGDPRGPQTMNLSYIGPCLMRFGTPEQKETYLPAMAAGKIIWCEGFSERESGSDLASLRTRAVRHGDEYVVNGQKMWTSYAVSPADWCLLLARTDPDAKKHRGISMILVDMNTPGISVRPVPSMAGPAEFAEVTFEDVRVPVANLLGPEHEGWQVAMYGLSYERVGIARHAKVGDTLKRLVDYVKNTKVDGKPLAEQPGVRTRLAELYCRYQAARLAIYRAFWLQKKGEGGPVESAIGMIHSTTTEQLAGLIGLEILGPAGQIRQSDPRTLLDGKMEREWLVEIGATLAGGTTEVQKSIIAQIGLGLPRSY